MTDIEKYYNQYGNFVFKRCLYLLKNEEEALDAMQSIFAKLLSSNSPDIKFPSTYLFRAATNECLNILRNNKRNHSSIDPILAQLASSEDIEKSSIIRETLEELFNGEKKSTHTIAVMHFIDKMKYAEIAEEMGMSISGIKKRLQKIKNKINIKEEYYAQQ